MNVKDELVTALRKSRAKLVCATIAFDTNGACGYVPVHVHLKKGYSKTDKLVFMAKLATWSYDNSYGHQYLRGTVWLSNNTWLERNDYDGSEWWSLKKYPPIPKHLR